MNTEIMASSVPSFDVQIPMAVDNNVPVRGVLDVVWRRKFLVLSVLTVILAGSSLVIAGLTPYYKSTATLLIDPQRTQPIPNLSSPDSPQIDMVAVKTQVSIIQSSNLATRVVEALDLTHAPEFMAAINAPPNVLKQWVTWAQEVFTLASPPEVPFTREQRVKAVAAMLLDRVTASNDGKSYLVEINAQTNDAQLSAKIANAFAKSYLDFNRKLKIDAIEEANVRFFDQLPPLAEKVRDADRAIQTFRVANGLTPAATSSQTDGRNSTLAEYQLAQVNTQIGEAIYDRTEREGRLRQINDALRGKGQIDAIPEIVSSSLIQALRQKQANLKSQQAALQTSTMASNPDMIAVTASQANVTATINAEIAKIAASVASSVKAAREREAVLRDRLDALKDVVASQSEAEIKLRDLQNQADAAREVYLSYLHRFQQTASLGLMQQPDAELISLADVPLGPAGPKRVQLTMLAAAVASIIAVLCALLRDRLRGAGFTSTQSLEAATGLTVLGAIPRLRRGVEHLSSSKAAFFYREALSNVRTTLEFGDQQYRAHVVLVTSALPQEGKTHFATSLARSVGARGGRALIIDCDLQRPAVAAALGLSEEQHIAYVSPPRGIDASRSRHLAIKEVAQGLDVGILQATPSDGKRLPSLNRARDELSQLRQEYDLIILDGPPVIACAEGELFCGAVDGVIMVVQWGRTTKGTILGALRTLQVYGVRTIGAVLNNVDIKQLARSGSDQGEFYSRYSRYAR